MKGFVSPWVMTLIALLVVGMMWTPPEAAAWGCTDMNLQRLVAEFNYFENGEAATSSAPPGIAVYQKMVFVPDGCDTLYVIMSATGDTHGGTASLFSCKLDFEACRPESSPAGETPGWIALQRHDVADDFHDNGIHYTWCTAVTPGTHAVEVRMATSDTTIGTSFLESAHFYVDASYTGGGCVLAEPTEDPPGLIPHRPRLSSVTPPAPAPAPAPAPTLPPLPGLR